MSITERSLLQQGTRVKIRRAEMPLESGVVGRTGMVVDSDPYRPNRYGVILNGETQVRYFAPQELEHAEQALVEPDQSSARKRLARP
ncbi:MAG: hypothetical protein P8Z36_14190 [Gemmatimonadota bacterium]|jgi:hypothetical protein